MEWVLLYKDLLKDKFRKLILKEGEILKGKVEIKKFKTKPPERYNPASLVKEMERLGLGTKATRAEIVGILYERKYIKGRKIKITPLGEKIIEIFEKYLPEILDIELTRKLENQLEQIERGKIDLKEKIIEETKEIVKNACNEIRKKEKEIGNELYRIFKTLKNLK